MAFLWPVEKNLNCKRMCINYLDYHEEGGGTGGWKKKEGEEKAERKGKRK